MFTVTWIRRIAVGTLVIGGAAYADWVLQLVLRVHTSVLTSYISELSIPGQPFATTFRLSDTGGGALIMIGAAGALVIAHRWWPIWSALLLLGVSNILEAMSPMRCAITFASACAPAGKQSLMTTIFNPHAWVSVVQTASCFFLVIAGTVALRRAGVASVCWWLLAAIGGSALFISVIEGALTVALLIASGDRYLGLAQRTEVTLTGLWLSVAPALLVLLTRRQPVAEGPDARRVANRRSAESANAALS